MDTLEKLYRINKAAFSVTPLSGNLDRDEKEYWLSKTPCERLRALELMRRIVYGYDPSSTRLERVLAIAELA